MDSACEAGFTKGCRDFLNYQEPTDEPNRIKSSLCAHKGGDMLLVVAEMVIHNRPFLGHCYQNPVTAEHAEYERTESLPGVCSSSQP